jgi:hypothetical protein
VAVENADELGAPTIETVTPTLAARDLATGVVGRMEPDAGTISLSDAVKYPWFFIVGGVGIWRAPPFVR